MWPVEEMFDKQQKTVSVQRVLASVSFLSQNDQHNSLSDWLIASLSEKRLQCFHVFTERKTASWNSVC